MYTPSSDFVTIPFVPTYKGTLVIKSSKYTSRSKYTSKYTKISQQV